jgi:hypothetical protein
MDGTGAGRARGRNGSLLAACLPPGSSRLRNLAIAPGVGGFQLADGTVADEFLHAVEVRLRMALHADLRGEFAFFRLPRRATVRASFTVMASGFSQ